MVVAALLLLQELAVARGGDGGSIGEVFSNARGTASVAVHGVSQITTAHPMEKTSNNVITSLIPRYTAMRPDRNKPVAGLPLLIGAEHIVIFNATPGTGTYNHGAQIERRDGVFHVAWNNSP